MLGTIFHTARVSPPHPIFSSLELLQALVAGGLGPWKQRFVEAFTVVLGSVDGGVRVLVTKVTLFCSFWETPLFLLIACVRWVSSSLLCPQLSTLWKEETPCN